MYITVVEALGRLVITGHSPRWVNHQIVVGELIIHTVRDGSCFKVKKEYIDDIIGC
jgi:hypothetical protein